MSKKYLIMDVDTGCDDSMALMLAAAQENFEILALTCTFGNNEVEKTTYNTLKVAQALGIDAPVASGAKRPLIDPPMDFSGGLGIAIHGADGLGNVGDTLKEPVKEKNNWEEYLEDFKRKKPARRGGFNGKSRKRSAGKSDDSRHRPSDKCRDFFGELP